MTSKRTLLADKGTGEGSSGSPPFSDPFKDMVRKYDNAVFKKGGTSIFGKPYMLESYLSLPLRKRVVKPPRDIVALSRVYEPRKINKGGGRGPKPGRIVAGLTGKLGGYAEDME